jgi:hypothetical protein
MANEEMICMALKYKSAKRPLGYTYFRDDYKNLVAIHDKDGNKAPMEEHHHIMLSVIKEMQRLNIEARKQKEHEESTKNI